MKLQANTHWTPETHSAGNSNRSTLAKTLGLPFPRLMPALGATLSAAVIVILATWAITRGSADILAASQWAIAFVFLALAVESYGKQAATLATSGVTVAWLAWMGSRVSPESAIVAAFLIATFAAYSVWTALRRS